MSEPSSPSFPSAPKYSMKEDKELAEPVQSNTDRLIAALQTGFHDLVKKQEEQSKSQEEQAVRLQKAIEALKPQAPATDKKTVFWNSYMKLADEHDKEFKEKYGTDLDTALIFAGLFSAVSSAFIIQIQPQLTPHADTVIVIVQSLLYISLFTTLLAALLAVLGKQWIMYYQAVGSRGTIEERGLERQRKFNGVQKWKLDMVLQMFPLLLQLALLLFSSALSVYLWTIHLSVAIIVLVLTLIGFFSYTLFLLCAMIFPDCPFQTPLAPFFLQVPSQVKSAAIQLWNFTVSSWFRFFKSQKHLLPCFASQVRPNQIETDPCNISTAKPSDEVPAVVWILENSTDPAIIDVAAEMGIDLQWPVNLDPTSALTCLAGALASCFRDRFSSQVQKGMENRAINCGRMYCSLRSLTQVRHDNEPIHSFSYPPPGRQIIDMDPSHFSQLLNVARMINREPNLVFDWDDPIGMKWALHILPSVLAQKSGFELDDALEHFLGQFGIAHMPRFDHSEFADYLCCVTSFLGPMSHQLSMQMHKQDYQDHLMAQLFKALQVTTVNSTLVTRIVNTTAQLAKKLIQGGKQCFSQYHQREIARFCSLYRADGWLNVVLSAATLARIDDIDHYELVQMFSGQTEAEAQEVEWIYLALEHVQKLWEENRDVGDPAEWDDHNILVVEGLLQLLVLVGTGVPSQKPTSRSLSVILQALSMTSSSVSYFALQALHANQTWFTDPQLGPIMQKASVWAHLGCIALKHGGASAVRYMDIGNEITVTAGWKPFVYKDLPTWVTFFSHYGWRWSDMRRDRFNTVIRNIWAPNIDIQYKFANEVDDSWALTLTALAEAWDKFAFTGGPPVHVFPQLARCTLETQVQHYVIGSSHKFSLKRVEMSVPLRKALNRAAVNVRNLTTEDGLHTSSSSVIDVSDDNNQHLERLAEFLDALGEKIGTESEPARGEVRLGGSTKRYKDWHALKNLFEAELVSLEELSITELSG